MLRQVPSRSLQVVLVVKNPPANAGDVRDMGSIHGWKILWRRTQKPTPALLPGESCGQKSLVVYNLHGHRVEHGWSYLICMHVPSVNTLMRIFIMIGCWVLPDIFFCVYWDNHVIFILYFVNVVYNIDWFENTEPSLHPWNKSHLMIVYDYLYILLNLLYIANWSWGFLHLYSSQVLTCNF